MGIPISTPWEGPRGVPSSGAQPAGPTAHSWLFVTSSVCWALASSVAEGVMRTLVRESARSSDLYVTLHGERWRAGGRALAPFSAGRSGLWRCCGRSSREGVGNPVETRRPARGLGTWGLLLTHAWSDAICSRLRDPGMRNVGAPMRWAIGGSAQIGRVRRPCSGRYALVEEGRHGESSPPRRRGARPRRASER
jgi:hypothetical protein